ncbi:hypothetical protein M407DRAFT_30852 [Tulasnella calospora MUT 4182]|uniref:Uncharacterized protein n=1 Tax=Tulasnella calospora MUT 4182 TaxID=1051891 RepID=A0A0C3LDF5_9AGAM|nr:hypothetical protein M407DRAFT_30852 [Tulasnella calospora MUT 4182]
MACDDEVITHWSLEMRGWLLTPQDKRGTCWDDPNPQSVPVVVKGLSAMYNLRRVFKGPFAKLSLLSQVSPHSLLAASFPSTSLKMLIPSSLFVLATTLLSYVSANNTSFPLSTVLRNPPPPPPASDSGNPLASQSHYFNQLIDHTNPSRGTFKQRYFFTDEFWTHQGDPIVVSNPGEQSADGFDVELTSPASLQRAVMMSLGAAGVVLEHRYYYGNSSPYQTLSKGNLKYLTLDQAIEDLKCFAEHAKLPWTKKATSSHPDKVPWVNMGCSYLGVLSAYTQQKYPSKFAAAWASSAPVQAQGDFW